MNVQLAVPPVGHRTDVWVSRYNGEATYRAAVVPQVADLRLNLPGQLAANVEAVTLALARTASLTSYCLDHQAATRALAMVEALASSRMEGVHADARALATALARPVRAVGDAALAAGNVEAVLLGADVSAATLGTRELALAMHRALLASDPAWAGRAGAWRQQLVWIGHPFSTPATAAFVPPRHDDVPAAMADLAEFCAREDLPALVQAAVAHAHFETIHPFGDGNGRVGRALVHATLARGAVADLPVPLSVLLAADKARYVRSLVAYRDGDAGPVVELFADAALHAAWLTREVLESLAEVLASARDTLARSVRPQALAHDLLPLTAGWPVLDAPLVRRELDLHASGAQRALSTLAAAGVLAPGTAGARNRTWLNRPVLDVVDRAARRLR